MKTISRFAGSVSKACGEPLTVLAQFGLVAGSVGIGAALHFREGWLLVFNLFLSVVTYLLLFVIQNTQNRDGAALHAKLDEIIHNQAGAREDLERIEDLDEAEIERRRIGDRT